MKSLADMLQVVAINFNTKENYGDKEIRIDYWNYCKKLLRLLNDSVISRREYDADWEMLNIFAETPEINDSDFLISIFLCE